MSWRDIVRKGDCDCEDCKKKRFEKQLFEKKGAKPDYIDLDKDGNTTESMKEAAKDAKKTNLRKRVEIKPRCRNKGCLRPANGTDGYGFCMPCEDDASENRLTDPNSPYTRENQMKNPTLPNVIEDNFDEYGYPLTDEGFRMYYKRRPKAEERDKRLGLGLYRKK